MRIIAVILLILLSTINVYAIPEYEIDKIADAIFLAEGGYDAQYLYGIVSVRYDDEADARRICKNTIRNNYRRWKKAGKPGTYLEFLRNRYCPIGAANDPKNLNVNWLKNVRYFLKKG